MEKYSQQKLLGRGSFGAAYLVIHKQTSAKYVIKEIMIGQLPPAQREAAKQEADVRAPAAPSPPTMSFRFSRRPPPHARAPAPRRPPHPSTPAPPRPPPAATAAASSQHRFHVRVLHRRRQALHRDGALRRRRPVPAAAAPEGRSSGRGYRAGLLHAALPGRQTHPRPKGERSPPSATDSAAGCAGWAEAAAARRLRAGAEPRLLASRPRRFSTGTSKPATSWSTTGAS